MSTTYSMCCIDCREAWWIGQSYTAQMSNTGKRKQLGLYDNTVSYAEWLLKHEEHLLAFLADYSGVNREIDGGHVSLESSDFKTVNMQAQ